MTPASHVRYASMCAAAACICAAVSTHVVAQAPARGSLPLAEVCARDATSGSPAERTLLAFASRGGGLTSMMLRPLARSQADSLATRLERQTGIEAPQSCERTMSPVVATTWYNSSRASTDRDGAVWQGKGITAAVTGGVQMHVSVLEVALRPLVFVTENREFSRAPFTADSGQPLDFRDPVNGAEIDLPYRFGARRYGRVDPGESYVRVVYRGTALGASTESQVWGPATIYPLVRSTEGAAYPRAFAETRDVPLRVARATAHWEVGWLEASPYTSLSSGDRSRISSAFTASVVPALFPSLEVGAARFFHVRRARNSLGWSTATLPFSGLLKTASMDAFVGGYNQVASAFFRVAPEGAGIDVYGEYYREDHSADSRDLTVELDHESAYMLGLRRAYASRGRVTAFVLEYANGRISHLARVRGETPIYLHTAIREGHSFLGQPLGSSALLGGGGTTLVWSRVEADRALDVSLSVEGSAQNGEGGTYFGKLGSTVALGVTRSCVVRGRSYSGFAELRQGTGFDNRANLMLGMSGRTSGPPSITGSGRCIGHAR